MQFLLISINFGCMISSAVIDSLVPRSRGRRETRPGYEATVIDYSAQFLSSCSILLNMIDYHDIVAELSYRSSKSDQLQNSSIPRPQTPLQLEPHTEQGRAWERDRPYTAAL